MIVNVYLKDGKGIVLKDISDIKTDNTFVYLVSSTQGAVIDKNKIDIIHYVNEKEQVEDVTKSD